MQAKSSPTCWVESKEMPQRAIRDHSKEEKMFNNNRPALRWLILTMIVCVTLACWPFEHDDDPPDYTPPLPTPTPQCGGDVSGEWTGSAGIGDESVPYSMKLQQTECDVTGTSLASYTTSATVTGYVEGGIFHFTESGPGNNCYWTGSLLLVVPPTGRDTLAGDVTNCSQKFISLER